jgi:hypothetical protein
MLQELKGLLPIAAFYVVMEACGVTCPIRFLSGISCAGCGMSRAWLALLRLDLVSASYFHPLFWLPVPTALVLWCRDKIPKWIYRSILFCICAAFLIVYLLRLFNPSDNIVVFQPSQGVLYQIFFKSSPLL